MTPARRRGATADLHNKLIAYWHDVDFNWGREAGRYYARDAVFETAGRADSYNGRAEIEAFYAYRLDRGPRVNMHAVTNFTCEFEDDDRAKGTWICLLYARDGEAPQISAPPISISRVNDIYVLEDGDWLVARRTWNPLFRGGIPGARTSHEDIQKRLAGRP